MANISFTGSHNSTFVVEDQGKILLVLETERFLGYKNSGLTQYKVPQNPVFVFEQIINYIKKTTGIEFFDNCFSIGDNYVHINGTPYPIHNLIAAKNYVVGQHHYNHATSVFYQSPYKESIIVSFDGGGNDGTFNVYHGKRESGISLLKKINIDLGFSYMIIGQYLKDIKLQVLHEGHLIYPGKIMGLVSYGNIRLEWLTAFEEYCTSCKMNGNYDYQPLINELQRKTKIEFSISNRLEGQIAYDVAATLQRAWENIFIVNISNIIYRPEFSDLPLCITGGCGLNILLNTRLTKDLKKNVFVGPVPNDTGIALGMILNHIKPINPVDVTYTGLPLLDIDMLAEYINNSYYNLSNYSHETLAKDIINGKIIGVARGASEIGPRGLGNRSILCSPMIKDMKNILNKKVKNREWYRPFAPVVRLEDVSKYFEWTKDSQWMSFAPVVKEEWREKLPATTHVDNTARVQTVTREQNWWLYDLLTEMEKQTGVGVLLNTSFNVNGKPILNTVKDIFTILKDTQLDGAVIEHNYITKHVASHYHYSNTLQYKW